MSGQVPSRRSSVLPQVNGLRAITKIKKRKSRVEIPRSPSLYTSRFKLREHQNVENSSMVLKSQMYRIAQDTSTNLPAPPEPVRVELRHSSEWNKIQTVRRAGSIPRLVHEHICQVTTESQVRSGDIHSMTRNYVDRRIGEPASISNIILAVKSRKKKTENKVLDLKRTTEMPPLQFSGEVLLSRSDPILLPYNSGANHRLIYSYKHIFPKENKSNETKIVPRKVNEYTSTGKQHTRHTVCLPKGKQVTRFVASKPPHRTAPAHHQDDTEVRNMDFNKTSHLWEKHVLGLISKKTAQWIASQCTKGEERERLVAFVDGKYDKEGETSSGGAMAVRKLLDINDDCLVIPKKKPNEERRFGKVVSLAKLLV